MATRKKTKKKAKKAAKKKSVARKKVVKKARPAARVKAKAKKKPAKPKAKATARLKAPVARTKPSAPAAKVAAVPANEERIGIVTHYYSHLSVAIIQLETGTLREGETVHIKGHTSDFRQPVGSMEVNHVHVSLARAGESFGLKVKEHAREHDVVYRVKSA